MHLHSRISVIALLGFIACLCTPALPVCAGVFGQVERDSNTPPPENDTTTEGRPASDQSEPTRLMMRGASSMPAKGTLADRQEYRYVVTLPPAMDLSIELESQPANAAVPELLDRDGTKVELRDEGEGTWMGAVPATPDGKEADFTVVVHKKPTAATEVSFILSVRVPELGDEGGNSESMQQEPSISAGDSSQGKSDRRTVIAKSGLSLRARPDPKATKLATLPFGTVVEVLDIDGPPDMYEGINAQWYKIRANGKEGWAFGGFIGEPGEMPTPEGSGMRGAIFNQPWEERKDGMRFFELSDPGTEKLKLQNGTWLTLEKGKTSGKFEFTNEGYLFYDGVFISRNFVAEYVSSTDDPSGKMVPEMATKLIFSPASPSGRQIFFTATRDSGCVNEYLLNLDEGVILNVSISKYGVDEWIEWSNDGKSVQLRYETEGSRFIYRLDIKTGKETLLKEETIAE
ncbi:MAG TPA: SH3 domain-containing protein [Candidatus Ozemobacteraceae bacterium]|nr:SH3 domain-containing protein [Candidatus Ozemobacteraceae bacterium]